MAETEEKKTGGFSIKKSADLSNVALDASDVNISSQI